MLSLDPTGLPPTLTAGGSEKQQSPLLEREGTNTGGNKSPIPLSTSLSLLASGELDILQAAQEDLPGN